MTAYHMMPIVHKQVNQYTKHSVIHYFIAIIFNNMKTVQSTSSNQASAGHAYQVLMPCMHMSSAVHDRCSASGLMMILTCMWVNCTATQWT